MRVILNARQRAIKATISEFLNTHLPDLKSKTITPEGGGVVYFEDNIEEFGPVVVEAFTKCPAIVWQYMDDAIGNADRSHGLTKENAPQMVRRVRNNPDWGRKLFKVIGR
jgi:hypothetical protein